MDFENNIMAETPTLRVGSISGMVLAGLKSVAIRVTQRQTTMPAAVMRRGKFIANQFCEVPSSETEDTTSAAHVASANEPNRSAPIPAMSPTLSPTLSAYRTIDAKGFKQKRLKKT